MRVVVGLEDSTHPTRLPSNNDSIIELVYQTTPSDRPVLPAEHQVVEGDRHLVEEQHHEQDEALGVLLVERGHVPLDREPLLAPRLQLVAHRDSRPAHTAGPATPPPH